MFYLSVKFSQHMSEMVIQTTTFESFLRNLVLTYISRFQRKIGMYVGSSLFVRGRTFDEPFSQNKMRIQSTFTLIWPKKWGAWTYPAYLTTKSLKKLLFGKYRHTYMILNLRNPILVSKLINFFLKGVPLATGWPFSWCNMKKHWKTRKNS